MKLYNSLTRKIDDFIPNNSNEVRMYTCGPTVYNYAHIGNLRSYIIEDILEKSLNYVGYNVTRVMNITDVGHLSNDSDTGNDKMISSAQKENKSVLEIAKFYTEAFKKDFKTLNLHWPEYVIPATSCIDTYITMIEKLLKTNYAYVSNGNVYFDTSKLKQYYVLTNQSADDMLVGVRDSVEDDLGKRNPQDFALWFTKSKFENQALKWDSPWGEGYPGWHIECSGISYKYLGEYLDIHCGGVDNKFPHHTNEIAQSESYIGHKWCNYWLHVEHLNLASGKMSKSSGNFITLTKLQEDGYDPCLYKFYVLQSHYRKELSFSYEKLDGAKSAFERIKNKIASLKDEGELDNNQIEEYANRFKASLKDDLNTSMAITILIEVLKSDLTDKTKLYLVNDFEKVLSLGLIDINKDEFSNEEKVYIESKILERKNAKSNKDFTLADQIREELKSKGIEILDTREGTTYKHI